MSQCDLLINDKYQNLRESFGEELDEMLEDIQNIRKARTTPESFRKKLAEYIRDTSESKILNDRENLRQIAKRQENLRRIFDSKINPEEGLASLLRASNYYAENAGKSVESVMNVHHKKYSNFLEQNLSKAERQIIISKSLDKEILHVLAGGLDEVSEPAKKIAGVFRKLQDMVYADKVNTGIEVNYLKDRGVNQRDIYNVDKMQSIGKDAWVEKVYSRLDIDKTFPLMLDPIEQKKYLGDVYDGFIDRKFDKDAVDFTNIPKDLIKSSIQRKNLKPRALHYTPEGLGQMWDEFSNKTLLDSMIAEGAQAARDIGYYDVLGPRGQQEFNTLKQRTIRTLQKELKDASDEKVKAKIQKRIDKINGRSRGSALSFEGDYDTLLANLNGVTDQVGSEAMAEAGENIRALVSMQTLGGSMFSALTDTFSGVTGISMATGHSYFKAISMQIQGMMQTFKPSEQKEIAEALAIAVESGMGNELRVASSNTSLSRGVNKLNKWYADINPIGAQGRFHRTASTYIYAQDLAKATFGKTWQQLGDEYKKPLLKSGISEADFEAFKAMRGELKGREVHAPHMTSLITDEMALDAINKKKAENPNFWASKPDEYRAYLQRSLSVLYDEFANFAAPQPGLREKAFLMGKTQKGTYGGELVRMLAMLKSFTVKQASIMEKVYLNNPTAQGKAKQLSAHTLGLMTMGYVALSLRSIVNNETPPDPTSPETIKKAFLMSGAAGLVGDMLLNEAQRGGGVLQAFVGGPVVSKVDDITELSKKLVTGESSLKDFGELGSLVPGNNLFYLKAGLNYTILDDWKETVSPGHKDRMRQRYKENEGLLWKQRRLYQ